MRGEIEIFDHIKYVEVKEPNNVDRINYVVKLSFKESGEITLILPPEDFEVLKKALRRRKGEYGRVYRVYEI